MYWVEMLDTGDAASMSPGTVNVLGGNIRLGMLPVCHQEPSMYWVEMLDTGDAASMSPGTVQYVTGTVNKLGGNVRHWGCCQYVTRYRQCTGWKC